MTEKSIENYYQIMKANRRLPWKSAIKKNCILVFGFYYFSGCHPSQVPAEDTFDDFLTQEDITALTKILEQDDVLKSTKSILKHIWPFKKYL